MASKKSNKPKSPWRIEEISEVADKLLALEEKSLEKWAKAPAVKRGEDMAKALTDKFGKLKKDHLLLLALWVDLSIYLPTVLHSDEGQVALMDKYEALEKLMELEHAGKFYIDDYLDWVSQFGCLLTEGSKSDIGAWFHDSFSEVLAEIEAITWTNTFFENESTSKQVSKSVSRKSVKEKVLAAVNVHVTPKELASLSKDTNSGVRYSVAANPKTPSKILKELSEDSSVDVRIAVAQNPSTPDEILKILSADDLPTVREMVALNPHTSREVLQKLSKDKTTRVRVSVAENANTTRDILVALYVDSDKSFHEALSTHPNTPLEIIAKLSKSKDQFIRSNIAERRDLPENILEALAKDKEEWVRRSLAENPTIPQAVIDLLSKDKDSLVREALIGNSSSLVDDSIEVENSDSVKLALASNANTPLEILAALAKNQEVAFLDGSFKSIRATVGKNPSINQEIAQMLFKTNDPEVLGALASNPKTPINLIEELVAVSLKKKAKKKWVPSDRDLELGLARNANTPSEYLLTLSQHSDIWTAIEVASNPNLPISTIEVLSKHKDERVRSSVASNPCAPWALLEFLSKDEVEIREKVANNPNTRIDVLEKLAKDEYCEVRAGVASNPSTPDALLETLREDSESFVRLALARNPNTSKEILLKLSKGDDSENHFVIRAVLDHPNTPEAIRDALLETLVKREDAVDDVAASEGTPIRLLESLYKTYVGEKPEEDFLKVTSTRYKVLLALSKNPKTPAELLAKLATDRDTDFREAVAGNPSAARETLVILSR